MWIYAEYVKISVNILWSAFPLSCNDNLHFLIWCMVPIHNGQFLIKHKLIQLKKNQISSFCSDLVLAKKKQLINELHFKYFFIKTSNRVISFKFDFLPHFEHFSKQKIKVCLNSFGNMPYPKNRLDVCKFVCNFFGFLWFLLYNIVEILLRN